MYRHVHSRDMDDSARPCDSVSIGMTSIHKSGYRKPGFPLRCISSESSPKPKRTIHKHLGTFDVSRKEMAVVAMSLRVSRRLAPKQRLCRAVEML